ncbi:uncharacterized protein B0I36DRAFT_315968 [Microdochium trichocladiopsis]|uniref:Uncharacterized protein n=1 Tax=Microdochium trichocladiopsis TaxID=1682393 RepID=A0A9P8YG11_9PEZI|nr:uncharacterized protein B0I36DRAFT_315968 [Microdochium trichocladiopsis]KAH7038301.1 hypothetical protein B0I36DRAFT_315968 [Microdochium trichocladiopsis]
MPLGPASSAPVIYLSSPPAEEPQITRPSLDHHDHVTGGGSGRRDYDVDSSFSQSFYMGLEYRTL